MATIENFTDKARTDKELEELLTMHGTEIVELLTKPAKVKSIDAKVKSIPECLGDLTVDEQTELNNINKQNGMTPIDKYCKIMDCFYGKKFRLMYVYYTDFYQLDDAHGTDSGFRDTYFSILKNSQFPSGTKNANNLYFYVGGKLPTTVKNSQGKIKSNVVHLSFISKLVHTVFPDQPIYDSNIRLVLWKLTQPIDLGNTYSKKVGDCSIKVFNGRIVLGEIALRYSQMKGAALGNLICDIFDLAVAKLSGRYTYFNYSDITFEKKCDFVFWTLGMII